MEYQPKLKEKYTPSLLCISSFQGTSYKNLQDTATSSFTSYFFTLAFASAKIICPNICPRNSKGEVDLRLVLFTQNSISLEGLCVCVIVRLPQISCLVDGSI